MHTFVSSIIEQLESELATATVASQQAHSSATDSENIADNKYDTLALEAAYLAHGQSVRIEELLASINQYKRFNWPEFNQQSSIAIGALITIEDDSGDAQKLFIGPNAGGLCIAEKSMMIRVITSATPLGRALLGKTVGDEVALHINNTSSHFTVVNIE